MPDRRVTGYDHAGQPIWERVGETRWTSPYHQTTIEIETERGPRRVPCIGIRKSSRLIRVLDTISDKSIAATNLVAISS